MTKMLEELAGALGILMSWVLTASGLFFAFKLKVFYILHPIKTIKLMFSRSDGGMSPVRAMSMALAGTLGVGNITGVTAAIAYGGAGAVFWMWAGAFFAMPVKYAETALAVWFRRREPSSKGRRYYGGAPYYFEGGLALPPHLSRAVASFFAILCAVNSLTTGNILQINAAAAAVKDATGVPAVVVGILTAALVAVVVAGGVVRISAMTVSIIPIVSGVYILMCTAVIIAGYDGVPGVFSLIFKSAFTPDAAVGGVAGLLISRAVRYGMLRGTLTNEAGLGTSPTAHACADAVSPTAQGCLGIFEVFVDTIVICTLTAVVVLLANPSGTVPINVNAMTSASDSFAVYLGGWTYAALAIIVYVFAYATLLSQHFYGKSAMRYLGAGKGCRRAYTFLFIFCTIAGSVAGTRLLWGLTDTVVGVMTILNTLAVLSMYKMVMRATEHPTKTKRSSKTALPYSQVLKNQ
ncbi:MAG: sodium:alanine symporter family protein [Clostridiales bacterium]|nr:sodium:alanine symporter family protein [Clostridiales bacterium]